MKKSRFIIAVAAVIVLAIAISVISFALKRQRLSSTFETLQNGDTKEKVIDRMGSPNQTEVCGDTSASDELNRNCRQELVYFSFLERWTISFDGNDKVINKSYGVLY